MKKRKRNPAQGQLFRVGLESTRWHLDDHTRRIGREGVAEVRAMLKKKKSPEA